jgi:uncharacterized protein YgbK (DUF1537 family)
MQDGTDALVAASAWHRPLMDQSIFILADDLTGSADAANYFRSERRRVRVVFTEGTPWDATLGPDVVQVFDTETRALHPNEAGRRVASAASPLAPRSGSLRIFKKGDSTLRGNLGVEIETALSVLGRPLAVFAPAFPAHGRAVRGGHLFVNGIPVTETSYATDPRAPVRADRVADVVRETTDLPVHEVGLDAVRVGPGRVADTLNTLAVSPGIAVCDGERQQDLETVASAVGYSSTFLPCGSDGLARALATVWGERARPSPRRREAGRAPRATDPPRARCHDVLIAVGSVNPTAHGQLAELRKVSGIPIVLLRARRLADAAARMAELTRGREEAARCRERILAVAVSAERVGARGGAAPRFEDDLARVGLAWIASRATDAPGALGLVCTGGDTALALVRTLGARAIWPEGEVLPGVPWSQIEGPPSAMLLVSKAGGFGEPAALLDAVRFLIDGGALGSRR